MRTGQGGGCRKSLHPRSDLLPGGPKSQLLSRALLRDPLTSAPETLLPASSKARPQPSFLRSRSPHGCSRRCCWAVAPRAAPGSSNLGAEPGSRTGTRARPAGSPAVREGWGIPGDPGRGGGPGLGAGGGVGHRSFQFVPLFEIGAGGALRSRDGASPISVRPCLRILSSNAAAARGSAAGTLRGG